MAGRKSTKTAAKTTETVVAEAIEPKAEEIKTEEIAETKATEPQEEPKKAPAKKTVGRPAKTARAAKTEAPAEETPKAAKKAAPKATGKKAVESVLHIQYAGRSYSQEDLLKIARDVWKYDLKRKVGELESVEMYVKPEENKVYYVMNGEVSGCFDI